MDIEGKCIVIRRRPDECLPAKEDAVPPEVRHKRPAERGHMKLQHVTDT
jgi:hypothetical protein